MKRIRVQKKIGIWKSGAGGADPPAPPTRYIETTGGDVIQTTAGENIQYT